MFAALSLSTAGAKAVSTAVAEVFPWVRHLSVAERAEFAVELTAALSDAAELGIDTTAQEVITDGEPPPGSRPTRACTHRRSRRQKATSDPLRLSREPATQGPGHRPSRRAGGMSGSRPVTPPRAGRNYAGTPSRTGPVMIGES